MERVRRKPSSHHQSGGGVLLAESPKYTKAGLHVPLFFGPHTLPALLPMCPHRLSGSWREWGIAARWPCLSPSAWPLALHSRTQHKSAELPLLFSAAWGQIILDGAGHSYYKKKKKWKKIKKERKHLKNLQTWSPWRWVFPFPVREPGLGPQVKCNWVCHQNN